MTGVLTIDMTSDVASMSHISKISGVHLLGDTVHPAAPVPGADSSFTMRRVSVRPSVLRTACSDCRSQCRNQHQPFSSGLLKKALWRGRREFERRGVLFQYVEVGKRPRTKSETFFSSPVSSCLSAGRCRQDGDLHRLRRCGSRWARIYGRIPREQERQPVHGCRVGSIR